MNRSRSSVGGGLGVLALLGAMGCAGELGGDFGDPDGSTGDAAVAEDSEGGPLVTPDATRVPVVGTSCQDPDRPNEPVSMRCESACGAGVRRCVDNRWTECSARLPTEEVCNGTDDDCDGAVDENLMEPCSQGCGAGARLCFGGRWTACMARSPSAEVCDGMDNDCDGQTDEGLTQACSGACGAGTQTCSAGSWGACSARSPSAEVCDGVDNNCNGQVDEGLSRACSGACGSGTQTCSSGSWSACSARSPSAEVCDGVDNNCNGQVDEGVTRGCSSACGSGSQVCVRGSWGACSAPSPQPEVCNLRDDNCDGRTDEGLLATFTFVNTCRYSRVFVSFGPCNACRGTCYGYWVNPGGRQPYQVAQNTCFQFSAFARTSRGDTCLTNRGTVYDGEVHRLCNVDCYSGSENFVCNGE